MKTNNNQTYKEVLSMQIELGRQLQLDYPNIVDEYKDIKNEIEDVVKKLGIMDRYQIPSEEIAKGVVHMALHGHSGMGSFVNTPKYKGLMSEKDLLDTSLQRRLRNRKIGINYPV